MTTINSRSQCREEKKNILPYDLFGDKIIQNGLKIYMSHLYGNDILLRHETLKRIAYPGS